MFKHIGKVFGRRRTVPLNGDDIAAEFIARTGLEAPVRPTPGWALLFRSPYEDWGSTTSWLGGVPSAPSEFVWPADEGGRPLHFLAQIDLASLKPEAETGARPPGLPEQGALLIFIGRSYACRVLSAADMRRASPASLPDGIGPVRAHGFFSDAPTFNRWPVDPVAFIDTTGERPTFLPDPFDRPGNWIVNHGIAALEARLVIECLEREQNEGRRFLAWREQNRDDHATNEVIESKTAYYASLANDAPPVVAALRSWREDRLRSSSEAPLAPSRLEEIFHLRSSLRATIEQNYPPKLILPGNAKKVWEQLRFDHPEMDAENDFRSIPEYLRPFVTMWLTDWRRHRLFGLEPPFSNNFEDRRGQDCLISIANDPILDTDSEHDYGMSIWCDSDRLVTGRFDKGQFIRHNAC